MTPEQRELTGIAQAEKGRCSGRFLIDWRSFGFAQP
jgi:hypothetical protein